MHRNICLESLKDNLVELQEADGLPNFERQITKNCCIFVHGSITRLFIGKLLCFYHSTSFGPVVKLVKSFDYEALITQLSFP